MTRWQKFEHLRDKGWTYNPKTGEICNSRGKVCNNTNVAGYVQCLFNIYRDGKKRKKYLLYGHHFAWLWVNGNVEINQIDHINQDKSDNRISNLRNVTDQKNKFNLKAKGYYFNKAAKKYHSQIHINYKVKFLGHYDTPEEARQAYLNAKQKYHVI